MFSILAGVAIVSIVLLAKDDRIQNMIIHYFKSLRK